MRALRIASAVALSALMVGGLTACDGKTPAKSDSASAATNGAPAVGRPADQDPQAVLNAVIDNLVREGSATMTLTGQQGGSSGSGAISWKGQPAAQMSVTQDGTTIKVIALNGVTYLGGDKAPSAVDGKNWLKIDPKSLPQSGGTTPMAGFASMQQELNPATVLKAEAKAAKVTKVGEEKVNGTDTVHLRAVVDVDAWVAALPGIPADQQATLKQSLKQSGATVTTELWVNGSDDLVQLRQPISNSAGGTQTMTIGYSDLGKPVTVSAPPAGEVEDIADMLKGLGG